MHPLKTSSLRSIAIFGVIPCKLSTGDAIISVVGPIGRCCSELCRHLLGLSLPMSLPPRMRSNALFLQFFECKFPMPAIIYENSMVFLIRIGREPDANHWGPLAAYFPFFPRCHPSIAHFTFYVSILLQMYQNSRKRCYT